MKKFSALLCLIFLAGAVNAPVSPVVSDAHAQSCLNPAEARKAVKNGQASPLSRVSANVRRTTGGEVVGANLCRRGNRLVYILTVLRSNGSATRVMADARSGRVVGR
ncbi:MAG: hypothetical protein AAGE61_19435 [Pseudomonadota bacterium]